MPTPLRFATRHARPRARPWPPAPLQRKPRQRRPPAPTRPHVDSPIRSAAEREADARRKPAEFLAFAQVRPGMKAFDLVSTASGGTAALLAAGGRSERRSMGAEQRSPTAKLAEAPHRARPIPNLHAVGQRPFERPDPEASTPPLDLITINLNYHDIVNNTAVDRAAMNKRLVRRRSSAGGHPGHRRQFAAKKGERPGRHQDPAPHRRGRPSSTRSHAGRLQGRRPQRLPARCRPTRATQPFFKMDGVPDDKFAVRFVKP